MPTRYYMTNSEELTSLADKLRQNAATSDLFAFPSGFISAMPNNTDEDKYVTNRSLTSFISPGVKRIRKSAFVNCNNLSMVSCANCSEIDYGAFYYVSSLVSVSFPNCKKIGSEAFKSCYSLQEAVFPECEFIGSYAFYYCKSLQSAYLPKCKTIGEGAFYYCYSLHTVTLSDCETIGSYAFYDCSAFKSLYLLGSSIITLNSTADLDKTLIAQGNGSIYVMSELLSAYKEAPNWSNFSAYIVPYQEPEPSVTDEPDPQST